MVNKKGVFVFATVFVAVLALLVSASFASAFGYNLTIHSPVSFSNNTGATLFNASFINLTYVGAANITMNFNRTLTMNWTNVSAQTHYLVNSTTCTAGSNRITCWGTITLNSTIDGIYNISVTAWNYNGSSHNNITTRTAASDNSSRNVTFDATPPAVETANISTNLGLGFIGRNYSHSTNGIIVLNVSVWDVNRNVRAVYFNITNSSGGSNSTIFATNAAGNEWNATLDTRTLVDGTYNITVYVNDTTGNVNSSATAYSIVFDNSVPTGTITCTPNPVSAGATITCSCSGSDSQSSVRTTTYTVNPATSSTGPTSTSCTLTNYANLTYTATYTYTVNSIYGGASSSGGSGSSTTDSTGKVSRSFAAIEAGETKTITGIASSFGVKEISISVNNKAQDVNVDIKKYDGKPASVTVAKTGKVYKYVEISATNTAGKISNAKITIQVEKSWVEQNSLTKENVALFRLVDGTWTQLPTTFKSEESGAYIYEAETPGFSYFSIAEKTASAGSAGDETTTGTGGETGAPGVGSSMSKGVIWTIIIIVIVVVAILIAYFLVNRKN